MLNAQLRADLSGSMRLFQGPRAGKHGSQGQLIWKPCSEDSVNTATRATPMLGMLEEKLMAMVRGSSAA